MKRKTKNVCIPVFSDEDHDLDAVKWRFDKDGYAISNQRIGDRVRTVRAHRIVLERMMGRCLTSAELCDHINSVRLDNRRENLRSVTSRENAEHKRAFNPTGLRGVTFDKRIRKWQAQVSRGGKTFYCGLFRSPEEAAIASAAKRAELGFMEGTK